MLRIRLIAGARFELRNQLIHNAFKRYCQWQNNQRLKSLELLTEQIPNSNCDSG